MRLGVNIDHIATLRQARLEAFPDPVLAAQEAILGGADGIVCHLREDRRHIQDRDIFRLRKLDTRLDLEMAGTIEMVKFALKVKPDYVTLVPEKRQELTTEGGLDIIKGRKKLLPIVKKLQNAGISVSLFIEPDILQVAESAVIGARFIEIHTGAYANAKTRQEKGYELEKISRAVEKAQWIGLRVNAGHGLDYDNIGPIIRIDGIEELNVGYSIIAKSVFVGMREAVKLMKKRMDEK